MDVQYERAPGPSAEFGGTPPGPTLSRRLEHVRLAWSIHAVVELGLADAAGDEPRGAEDIALLRRPRSWQTHKERRT